MIDQLLVYLYTGTYNDLAVLSTPDADKANTDSPSQTVPQKRPAVDDPESDSESDSSSDDSLPESDLLFTDDEGALPIASTKWQPAKFGPKATRLASASPADITKVLKTSILVAQCAVMMDLSELVKTAIRAFFRREQYWLRSDFAEVLQIIFSKTASDDSRLRIPLLDRCLQNHSVLDKHPAIIHVIEQHEPTAWHFGVRLKIESEVSAQDLRKNLKKAREGELTAKNQLERIGNLRDQKHENLEKRLMTMERKNKNFKEDIKDLGSMCPNVLCPTCNFTTTYSALTSRDSSGRKEYKCASGHVMISGRQRG